MPPTSTPSTVAVIGAGIAGAACAAALHQAGLRVRLFDKAPAVGGRMATRRSHWTDAAGTEHRVEFDHGAQHFSALHARFRAVVTRAQAAGRVAAWTPQVFADWPVPFGGRCWVPQPDMPALCRHLLADVPLQLASSVQRLLRSGDGWRLQLADGSSAGPFERVLLALPPRQAALLVAGHHDLWAEALAAQPMWPCWALMAVTDDIDWGWDAARPASGPLAWVARNDRKPGRGAPAGWATWVAQATPAWTAEHLDDTPQAVQAALQTAMSALLPRRPAPAWHHVEVKRWLHAAPAAPAPDGRLCWWDARRGLGVCGDFLGGGDIEAAWRSGDELADTVAASIEAAVLQPA